MLLEIVWTSPLTALLKCETFHYCSKRSFAHTLSLSPSMHNYIYLQRNNNGKTFHDETVITLA